MKKYLFVFLLMFSAIGVWADEVPTLLILMTQSEQIQIPIASIKKITYNEAGTTMYVATSSGTQTFAVSEVSRMTLANVPQPTALHPLSDAPIQQLTKFEKEGVVYIVKDGKIYTMKGEQK